MASKKSNDSILFPRFELTHDSEQLAKMTARRIKRRLCVGTDVWEFIAAIRERAAGVLKDRDLYRQRRSLKIDECEPICWVAARILERSWVLACMRDERGQNPNDFNSIVFSAIILGQLCNEFLALAQGHEKNARSGISYRKVQKEKPREANEERHRKAKDLTARLQAWADRHWSKQPALSRCAVARLVLADLAEFNAENPDDDPVICAVSTIRQRINRREK